MWLFDEIMCFLISLDLPPGAMILTAFLCWFLLGAVLSVLIGGLVRLVFDRAHSKART